MEIIFLAYIVLTITLLLTVGFYHDEPTDIVVNTILWPAIAVVIVGCLLRDIFDRIFGREA